MSDDLRQKAIDFLVTDIVARVKADDPKATLEIRALVAEKLLGSAQRLLGDPAPWATTIRGPYNAAPPSVLERTINSDPPRDMAPSVLCVGGVTLPKESA